MTIDQIGTYGYVAEAAGGSEVESTSGGRSTRSPPLGDFAARRTTRIGETKIREKLISAGMYGTTPRKILGYQVLCAIAFALLAFWLIPALGGRSCSQSWAPRWPVSPAGSRRSTTSTSSEGSGSSDRQADAGHDRPARRHDRGGARDLASMRVASETMTRRSARSSG